MKLIIDNLTKSFTKKQILKNCSFTFEKGKIYGLLGRNGAGKTTLFNCISKEMKVDEGHIWLQEGEQKRKLNEMDIGYAYSLPLLPEFLTGYEFLKFYIDIHAAHIENIMDIDDYMDMMHFEDEDRHKLIKSYSHGMKNKLQMLCFIITQPDVILLDEPLTSFDVVVANEMKHVLLNMKEKHILIFSTHILQLATDLCDEIILLNNGELELIEHSFLERPDFEERVVEMLKDEHMERQ